MATAENTELIDRFEEFYRNYYRNEIGELAQKYPNDQKSLYIDWDDLYRFDQDLADDYRTKPSQLQEFAEEALRLYDLPVDVSLGQAHVRVRNLPESEDIREIRHEHHGNLISVQGIVRKATDVRPKVTEAAFECQRCGTLSRIPQTAGDFQEPHECQGCERQGPFRLNTDQSQFIDAQKIRVQESPEGLRGGETPQSIDINVEDDITGTVTAGDHVRATGILKLDQQGSDQDKSPMFDIYMDGVSIVIEDEQFEDMDITDADKKEIVELSNESDIYDQMVGAIAPSIYGYEKEKLAMMLQLFSGVTKELPDGSRIRGDLHMLLIGDPGTGKCVSGDTRVTLADGRDVPIQDIVESNLDEPKPVDDGVWDAVDFEVPSLQDDGTIATQRATKVWKREAPDQLYRIRTATGREVEVTPSHPLFVQSGGRFSAVKASELREGDSVATAPSETVASSKPSVAADGGTVVADCDRIESIEPVEPDEEWVYDLEIEGTHNYVSNGVVSHNSQMLSYIEQIAPRSVYTSGKGSSSAGLCVTGDTRIHTEDGFRKIRDLAVEAHPEPVAEEARAPKSIGLQTFDRESGSVTERQSSHVWRMPKKPCWNIETAHGKSLTASENTPVLTCGEDGLVWVTVADLEPGQHVAVPKYGEFDREEVSVREFLELTTEKVKLADASVERLREALCDRFGHLRAAASALDLSEDFIYDSLRNRHVPLSKLDTILDAVELSRTDVDFDRLMVRHGDSIAVPETFDDDLMYLLGLVFGDGDISLDRRGGNRGMVRISNGDEELLERAQDIFAAKFDKRPDIERQEGRVSCIRVGSATIARLFSNAGMETPKADLQLAPELTTAAHADAFVRGLMDADGSVSVRENGGSSVLTSTISETLAEQLQLILETYGIRARRRERDRRGTYELDDGQTIESKHVQHFVELYGADIDRYAVEIGFDIEAKQRALQQITADVARRGETVPVGSALMATDGAGGEYHSNISRGDNPGRERAREILDHVDLGDTEAPVREAVEADLRWDRVVEVTDVGEQEVFDLTVPETHNFVGNGLVTHNTAAAVRDDFGDGQQWTLEAGALVLADQGIAAVDELDKMSPEDRSAMHEALEQQRISVSKAGINATLKSRCSLLGAANPKYGRFDQYEPIGEQIDLEPALISRFDLIFTVTDKPDEEKDRDLAEHIVQTNYAGELHTHRTNNPTSNYTEEEVDTVTDEVAPTIEPELLRKYIAYSKRNCFPTMTEEAKTRIEDFYVELRMKGQDEDAPVPVTARKLEALVRLAEASARIRLSDTVEESDADRAVEIAHYCLKEIGVDPETGEFDADVVETGTSKTQRDRIQNIRGIINDIEDEYDEGAPIDVVVERAEEVGIDESKAEHEIEKLKQRGEVYEPRTDHLRTT
ncbi:MULTISPECIES: LAGLIDADG family homing endonuclease [Haloarcula]|uniref:LAGLIDADG family homing endonuclease n=1 Tax=Haloarcula TaxID=2237 RepID=UPI0023E838C3|nr:LAGLIDADG family homing endonuclease [Halomicroarcula sp. SHR3]